MSQKYLDAKGYKYLDMTFKSSSHAELLISKLLNFSNNIVEDEKPVDVHELIHETESISFIE